MTNHFNDHNPEREEPRFDTPERDHQELHATGEIEKPSDSRSGRQSKRPRENSTAEGTTPKAPRSTRKRSQAPRAKGTEEAGEQRSEGGSILRLPVPENAAGADVTQPADAQAGAGEDVVVHELEAQGFTSDEAIRLIHVSDRVATSREAREAEASLRRLRFTRWLIERGVLDEFSA